MRQEDDTRHAIPNATTRQDPSNIAPDGVPRDASPDASSAILQIDAARHAGVSVRTIQRAIDRGDLPAKRDGGHCWIQLEDLDRWQLQRTTRRTPPRVVAHDNDASRDATGDMPGDASRHDTPAQQRPDPDVERLRAENADLKVERDRWHQAFKRESALREEETRQLRQLIQQEQALSFTRFAAIEATTRHDATSADASPDIADDAQDATPSPRHNDAPAEASEIPTPSTDAGDPPWRRWWRRMTGGA